MIVCQLCDNSCAEFTARKIKSGHICRKCAARMDGYLGTHFSEDYDENDYNRIIQHPALAEKELRKRIFHDKQCIVCGYGNNPFSTKIANGYKMCKKCYYESMTISHEVRNDPETYFESHDYTWFRDNLDECYMPTSTIVFNFKTKKVYLMNSMLKSNYKIVDFSDLIKYKVSGYDSAGIWVREISLNIRYEGTVIRYHLEDSTEDSSYGFDRLLDCLKMIPELSHNEISTIEQSDNKEMCTNMAINTFSCPRCGGTDLTPVVEQNTSGKDFSATKGCCGFALLGPIGILCGACGGGKQTTSTTYWMCKDCGNRFKK